MASILKVNTKRRAQIRRKGHPPRTKTFSTKALAQRWAAQVEGNIEREEADVPPVPTARTTGEWQPEGGGETDDAALSPTELKLLLLHRSPAIRLDEICERYLQMGRATALRQAGLNRLPFPTFRLAESQKAPVMVAVADLASHIDLIHNLAKVEWERSQI